MIRASLDDVERINDWVWRDSGSRPDFTQFIADRHNVSLIEGEGGALFVWRGPGIFEVHLFFEQRGKEALTLIRAMFERMREEYGAKLFWAAVPVTSRHVIMFARLVGWKSQGFGDFPQGRCELFQSE
jgi:hypothetical protein